MSLDVPEDWRQRTAAAAGATIVLLPVPNRHATGGSHPKPDEFSSRPPRPGVTGVRHVGTCGAGTARSSEREEEKGVGGGRRVERRRGDKTNLTALTGRRSVPQPPSERP